MMQLTRRVFLKGSPGYSESRRELTALLLETPWPWTSAAATKFMSCLKLFLFKISTQSKRMKQSETWNSSICTLQGSNNNGKGNSIFPTAFWMGYVDSSPAGYQAQKAQDKTSSPQLASLLKPCAKVKALSVHQQKPVLPQPGLQKYQLSVAASCCGRKFYD